MTNTTTTGRREAEPSRASARDLWSLAETSAGTDEVERRVSLSIDHV